MKKVIAVDMDNVLVDIEVQMIDWYEREFGIRINREAMAGVAEDAAFPDPAAAGRLLHMPGFFRSAPLKEGAKEALAALCAAFDVYIVSAATEFPVSLKEKHDWLGEHLPFISWQQMVFCGHKHIIRADYMIDDHLKNLDNFQGKTLLFTAGHNVHVTRHTRVNNWAEVLAFFAAQTAEADTHAKIPAVL